MNPKMMILPASRSDAIRLLRVPDDFESHEAYRRVTGLIAAIEESGPGYGWEDIQAALEDQGFEPVEFILGPALD
jgi:hypothetical protein